GSGFEFVKAHQADFPVRMMCRVLGLSPSGYYAWLKRPVSARAARDADLVVKIRQAHEDNRSVYGRPRIFAELKEQGERVGQKRVARLMRQEGIVGVSRRRRGPKTTKRSADARPAADLVERNFTATGPNQLWVADITYIPTRAGFLYLAVVLDAWSRKIVGWSLATHLRTELVLDALHVAVWQGRTEQAIHHSDQGTQPNTRPSRSASAARRSASGPRWARSAMRTTTRCARASSPHSSASSSISSGSGPRPRPRWPCSTLSRASTTPAGGTRRWATSRRPTTSDAMRAPPEPRTLYSPAARGKLPTPAAWGSKLHL